METFAPAVGELCVLVTVSATTHEILYCFRDQENDPIHFRAICRMRDFAVLSCDSGYVMTNLDVAQIQGIIGNPAVQHLHVCTYEELQAIRDLWREKCSFEQWLLELEDDSRIPEKVKKLLKTLQ